MPTKRDKVWQAEVSYKHHGTFKKWRKSWDFHMDWYFSLAKYWEI